MNDRTRRLLSLLAGAAFQCITGMAAAGEAPLPAYAPVIAASNQRRDAAQQALADWRAKRDGLLAKQDAAEKKIKELAGRLGADTDAGISAINDRIKAAEAWAQTLDAAIKGMNPASFSTVAQMAKYDQMTDERNGLKAAIQAAQREIFDLTRKLVHRDPQGAAMAEEWEAPEPQCVAAANEATLAQIRRDTVVRAEGALLIDPCIVKGTRCGLPT